MKNFILCVMLAAWPSISSPQVIRTVEIKSGDDLAELLGEDKYNIDSLILKGFMDESGYEAFADCCSNGILSGINMADCEVKDNTIPEKAFSYCYNSNLRYFTMPKNLERVCDYAFYYNKIQNIQLPPTLRHIGSYAFQKSFGYTEHLIIPESVTVLGYMAFGETNIRKITLPSTLKKIPQYAFYASDLEIIELNDGTEEIGDCAFFGTILKDLTLPESVTKIGFQSFHSVFTLENIVLSSNIEEIPEYNFSQCFNVKSLVLPEKLRIIKDYSLSGTFQEEELILPDGVEYMGEEVFWDNPQLKRLVLPASLQYISGTSFEHVSQNLKEVYAKSPTPPNSGTIGVPPFKGLPEDAVLYVPEGSLEAYKSCRIFKRFLNIRETSDFPSSVGEVTSHGAGGNVRGGKGMITIDAGKGETPYAIYSNDGRLIGKGVAGGHTRIALSAGLYIVQTGGKAAKVAVR